MEPITAWQNEAMELLRACISRLDTVPLRVLNGLLESTSEAVAAGVHSVSHIAIQHHRLFEVAIDCYAAWLSFAADHYRLPSSRQLKPERFKAPASFRAHTSLANTSASDCRVSLDCETPPLEAAPFQQLVQSTQLCLQQLIEAWQLGISPAATASLCKAVSCIFNSAKSMYVFFLRCNRSLTSRCCCG